jgi:hypothetical protein
MMARYGLAIFGVLLIGGFVAFCLAAFYTADWRYLIGAVICWAVLAGK